MFFAGIHHDWILQSVLYFCSLEFNSSVYERVQSLVKGKARSWSLFSQREATNLFGFCIASLPSVVVDTWTSFEALIPDSIMRILVTVSEHLSELSVFSNTVVYAVCLKVAWIYRPRLFTWKPTATVEEILMFPDKSQKNLGKIVRILDDAKYSLDVCVFTITNDSIEDALLKAHARGVVVRIISDDLQMKTRGCELEKLSRSGIEVKHDGNFSKFMHHKFCVVDEFLLLTGSFNWTAAAWKKNNENLIVLSGREVVERYQDEFETLWLGFPSMVKRRKRLASVCGRLAFWQ